MFFKTKFHPKARKLCVYKKAGLQYFLKVPWLNTQTEQSDHPSTKMKKKKIPHTGDIKSLVQC